VFLMEKAERIHDAISIAAMGFVIIGMALAIVVLLYDAAHPNVCMLDKELQKTSYCANF